MNSELNSVNLPNAQAVFIHDDTEVLSTAVAQRIAALAAEAIDARGVFHLALAGGETPRRCYEKLRYLAIDWGRVHLYFGDERCLPEGDARRNDSMARVALLNHVALPQANIHRIAAELGAIEAAARYTQELTPVGRLDLVLLGMGEDGHTASLFPDNPANARGEAAVPVFNAPKPPAERVSLSMGTLNAARNKLFLVAGAGKREALEQIMRGVALPAAQISMAEWHLDRAALPITNEPRKSSCPRKARTNTNKFKYMSGFVVSPVRWVGKLMQSIVFFREFRVFASCCQRQHPCENHCVDEKPF